MERLFWTFEVFRRGQPLGLFAKFRWFYWRHIRRYKYEMCHRCGGRVGPNTNSWWHAPDDLWIECEGPKFGILCPPCFSDMGQKQGKLIYYIATDSTDR